MMSGGSISLGGALHGEIARRAEAWMDSIARATADTRINRIDRAAADMLRWLMLAEVLGCNWAYGRPEITIHGPLSLRLESADLRPWPAGEADWQAMRRTLAQTLGRARERCEADPTPARTAKMRELRLIEFYLDLAARDRHPVRQLKEAS